MPTYVKLNPDGSRADAGRPKPKGLLPVPPEVEVVVARECAKQPMTPEAKQRLIDSLTLQYYYEDETIVYRRTPAGVEVLAVGPGEIGSLVRGMSQEELLQVRIGQP
jgi:hypothetical protein